MKSVNPPSQIRRLCLVLGDQLNLDSAVFDEFDPAQDAVWMAELPQEQTHVKSHKQRMVLFLSAMRHFAQTLNHQAWSLHYLKLGAHEFDSFEQALAAFLAHHSVEQVAVVLPGEQRGLAQLKAACKANGHSFTVLPDRHFISLPGEFKTWMQNRKQPRLEYWYRHLRQRTGILMQDDSGQPIGGQWNFDKANRQAFGKDGPPPIPEPVRFAPDAITQEVMDWIRQNAADHPGELDEFAWPVTREQALDALDDFIQQRLPDFGRYQDAMWPNQAWLFHATLSPALNLKLLNPLEVIQRAEQAYHQGSASIEAVEGFVRQLLGWREYVRGLYWFYQPNWSEWNALEAQQALPNFYWTGDTDMACLRSCGKRTRKRCINGIWPCMSMRWNGSSCRMYWA